MRVPKDLRVSHLVKKLELYGYVILREKGSHMTVGTELQGKHVMRIPDKSPVAPGTLRTILQSVAAHFQLDEDELLNQLDL